MKAIDVGMLMLLATVAGAQEQPLSGEQQDACGAILCLAGGGATPECNPYLKRFFDTKPKHRRRFLKQCPTSGVSEGALRELAAHGQTCEPNRLVQYLNGRSCAGQVMQPEDGPASCRRTDPNAWRMCASYYAELTDQPPPRLVQRCRNKRDGSGAIAQVCSRWWVISDYATGSWCKDKDASCEETDVSSEANRPIASR